MSTSNRASLVRRLTVDFSAIAGKDPASAAVGKALGDWIDVRLSKPKQAENGNGKLTVEREQDQYTYLLNSIGHLRDQKALTEIWYGGILQSAVQEAGTSRKKQGLAAVIEPSISLLSIVRYNLAITLFVLYEMQASGELTDDQKFDLEAALADLEKLRAATRPIQNQLSRIFGIETSVPSFPSIND